MYQITKKSATNDPIIKPPNAPKQPLIVLNDECDIEGKSIPRAVNTQTKKTSIKSPKKAPDYVIA
jgi:hypothetical protein